MEEDQFKINLAITIGGDGTILYAVQQFQNRQVPPLFTIAQGTLGFLCQYGIQEAPNELKRITNKIMVQKEIEVQQKMRLKLKLFNKQEEKPIEKFNVLNEIVIYRDGNQTMILDLYLNNKFFTTVKGDGLILNTPTGSTAYALSSGGSIIQPTLKAISIVPISPHSLSFRPIVLSYDVEIKIQLSKDSRVAGKISGDGQKDIYLNHNQFIILKISNYSAPVICDKEGQNQLQFFHSWMDKLKILLKWNANFA
ncbi:ATP-NAD kinase-like domain [Pseudocohnilembus persalinus]|uniref:ATP-NAD kinase-like domain n=1 Tax=Pseudocohnilembus persalinus TaxID=266149 RepID=A0A0V0QSG3_PSEPJ|nr:ATP-NAD kinase-like domain [Pseudocohnilembus persalinus]|eukprot:KRX05212.1 ATP-NAD kinase-like domain [Pseudocohnilembus persalinus]